MPKTLYHRVLAYAGHPEAEKALFLVALMESSFFPVPPDVLLIPLCILNTDKAFRYAMICTLGSVLGGILGYALGFFFFETAGSWLVHFYGADAAFETFRKWYSAFDVYIVAAAGFSPVPYKIFTIASGMVQANFFGFTLASLLSRGARFGLEAWLLWRSGPSAKGWIENNLAPLSMIGAIAMILAVVFVKLVFL